MNADEHIRRFVRERDRISHDLVQNVFFAGLQPCGGGSGRLGDADLIFAALRGEAGAKVAADEVMSEWRIRIAPAINALAEDVSQKYGFVPSERWQRDVKTMLAACNALSAVSFEIPRPAEQARAEATKFWAACDEMCRILGAIKTDFSKYFLKWDKALIHA